MGLTAKRLVRTMSNSRSSWMSNSSGTSGTMASLRRPLARRVLFLRILRSIWLTASSIAPRISPSASSQTARNSVPLAPRSITSTMQRFFFSTAKVTVASGSSLKYFSSLPIFFSAYALTESFREIFLQVNVNFITVRSFQFLRVGKAKRKSQPTPSSLLPIIARKGKIANRSICKFSVLSILTKMNATTRFDCVRRRSTKAPVAKGGQGW